MNYVLAQKQIVKSSRMQRNNSTEKELTFTPRINQGMNSPTAKKGVKRIHMILEKGKEYELKKK